VLFAVVIQRRKRTVNDKELRDGFSDVYHGWHPHLAGYSQPIRRLSSKMTATGLEDEGTPRDSVHLEGAYNTFVWLHLLDGTDLLREEVRCVIYRLEVVSDLGQWKAPIVGGIFLEWQKYDIAR
jgi:hypothetical protein